MKKSRFSSVVRGYIAIIKGELLAWVILGFITLIFYLITMIF